MSDRTLDAYRARRRAVPVLPRRTYGRRAQSQAARQAQAGRCARFHGGAARRGRRQPLADARPRGRALLRALPGARRQGQGGGACRRAHAETAQDLAEAAHGQRRQAHDRCRSARRRNARAVGDRARCRRARLALRRRLAHLRSARPETQGHHRRGRAHRHRQRQQGAHGAAAAASRQADRRLHRALPLRSAARRRAVRRQPRRAAVAHASCS